MFEKETLVDALAYAHISDLPSVLDDGKVFVRALARVKKSNNHESICYVINDGSGKPLVKRTFGTQSPITEVLAIYPIDYLVKDYLPNFKNKEEIAKFLIGSGEDEGKVAYLLQKEPDQAKKLVYFKCITSQIKNERNIPIEEAETASLKKEELSNEEVNNNNEKENEDETEGTKPARKTRRSKKEIAD